MLGACEMARGHADAAMAAWSRVPEAAPEAPMAALSRGRTALMAGRYGLAERDLDRAVQAKGEVGAEAARLLSRLYWMTGRREEHRDAVRRDVERLNDPSETLRVLWSLDRDPPPIDAVIEGLERAGKASPDDDRVWLGLADLAIRTGRIEEADDWLTRCERAARRAHDLAAPARMGPGRRATR